MEKGRQDEEKQERRSGPSEEEKGPLLLLRLDSQLCHLRTRNRGRSPARDLPPFFLILPGTDDSTETYRRQNYT
jgi:hypothetical protein